MSTLTKSFKSVETVTAPKWAPHIRLSVWRDTDKPGTWHASFAAAGGVGGQGTTPEEAIDAARRNYCNLARANGHPAGVKDAEERERLMTERASPAQ